MEHSLPNVKSKTWSFRSPCFKCVLSKVTRIASSMLNWYTYMFMPSPPHTICLQTYSKISLSRAGTQHQVDKRIEKKFLPDAWQSSLAWRAWASNERQVQSHHLDSSLPHQYRATVSSCRLCSGFRDGTETSSTLRCWLSACRAVVPSEVMRPSGVFCTRSEIMELSAFIVAWH